MLQTPAWTDFTYVLRWLKLLYNHIVYMGNKLIHGKTLHVLKISFLWYFIITLTACEMSPQMWKDFALLLLYDHIALVVNSSMMVYCKGVTGQLDL